MFFRASTREQANELGISGYARNLADGRVEVLIVGQLSAVNHLLEWLRRGPPAARVDDIAVEELDLEALSDVPVGFATR